ncbi:MAG: cell division protein FtsA [Nitratiruptor sp.]|nr:cell division protein FtsA [Nitratiruptor sp.]NPA83281.1 cell division protein FtsA [Campylobacterota bacterium]
MPRNILAIDIGSTKICSVIARMDDAGIIQVLGSGIKRSQGIKKGVITNIDLASKSIKEAYHTACRVAGTSPDRAIVSISGAYIKSVNSSSIVNIPNKEISLNEINRALQTAHYNANIPHDYEVLHILPYKFKVDDQDFIEDPLGMTANRLEAEVHIVSAPKSSIFNLKKAVRQAGIEIENIVLAGYASAIAVLGEDEKELGAAVIDMGGSTCDLVIHLDNSIVYNDFLGVGSMHITNDLSMALHTPISTAEEIKIHYGDLNEPRNDYIEIPVIGDSDQTDQVSLETVYSVIYARVEETLMILAKSIEESGLKDQLGAGVILTGGMTKLGGIRELATALFDNLPTRIGKPKRLEGFFDELDDPAFATVVGLVLYGAAQHTLYEIDSNKRLRTKNLVDFTDNGPEDENGEELSPQEKRNLEALEKLNLIQSAEPEGGDLKEKVSKLTRWLTQLF